MAIFNRNKKVQTQAPIKELTADFLNEYAKSSGVDFSTFIQGIHKLDTNYINNDLLLDRMCEDSIISSAISMWIEDALQRDPYTKEVFHVELDVPKDKVEDELSKGLTEELNNFLKKDLKMEENLPNILYRVIKYGQSPIKLDFADLLDDAQLELKESNMQDFAQVSVKLTEMFGDIKSSEAIDSRKRRLNEKVSSNYEIDNEVLCETYYNIPVHALSEKGILKETAAIKAKHLNEEDLKSIKRMIKGRWYYDLIGHGTNIYSLTAKQKLIAYLDRDNLNKFIKPSRIVNFTNNTGKHRVQFEIGRTVRPTYSKEILSTRKRRIFLRKFYGSLASSFSFRRYFITY